MRITTAQSGHFARARLAGLALVIAFLLPSGLALAQSWPTRTVTIVVPYAAGGSMDSSARIYARELTTRLGQPVIIENRAGANGGIGMTYVAKAPPDGYTLVVTGSGPATLNKLLYKSLSYDPYTEFTAIVATTEVPNVLAASPRLPVQNVAELIEYARKKDGGLTLGHGGAGGSENLTALLFLARANLKGVLISYRGTGPFITDLIGGQIDMGFPAYFPQVSSVKVLGVTGIERVGIMPDVPTLREVGARCRVDNLERHHGAGRNASGHRHEDQRCDERLAQGRCNPCGNRAARRQATWRLAG